MSVQNCKFAKTIILKIKHKPLRLQVKKVRKRKKVKMELRRIK